MAARYACPDATAGDDAEDILTGLLHEEEGKRLNYLRELTRLWSKGRWPSPGRSA
jgi:hypothetical protein